MTVTNLSEVMEMDAFPKVLNTKITKAEAVGFINHYRADLPEGSIKSVWIGPDIIKFIVSAITVGLPMSGIRVYLGKYKEGVGATQCSDPASPFYADTLTAILAITEKKSGINQDISNAYFDYGQPCPPYCNIGDAGGL